MTGILDGARTQSRLATEGANHFQEVAAGEYRLAPKPTPNPLTHPTKLDAPAENPLSVEPTGCFRLVFLYGHTAI